ncbi:hypothetical protein V8F20_011404 [Naviculisporaceae sp. PSN 640]
MMSDTQYTPVCYMGLVIFTVVGHPSVSPFLFLLFGPLSLLVFVPLLFQMFRECFYIFDFTYIYSPSAIRYLGKSIMRRLQSIADNHMPGRIRTECFSRVHTLHIGRTVIGALLLFTTGV